MPRYFFRNPVIPHDNPALYTSEHAEDHDYHDVLRDEPPNAFSNTDQYWSNAYRHDLDLGMTENIGPSLACIVIMPETLLSENVDVHYNCLEMVPINWSPSGAGDPGSDDGILLEVWRTGGLVHSCVPIPKDSLIELVPGSRIIQAQVSSCEPDEHYGFLVQVSVDPDHYDYWFLESFIQA